MKVVQLYNNNGYISNTTYLFFIVYCLLYFVRDEPQKRGHNSHNIGIT